MAYFSRKWRKVLLLTLLSTSPSVLAESIGAATSGCCSENFAKSQCKSTTDANLFWLTFNATNSSCVKNLWGLWGKMMKRKGCPICLWLSGLILFIWEEENLLPWSEKRTVNVSSCLSLCCKNLDRAPSTKLMCSKCLLWLIFVSTKVTLLRFLVLQNCSKHYEEHFKQVATLYYSKNLEVLSTSKLKARLHVKTWLIMEAKLVNQHVRDDETSQLYNSSDCFPAEFLIISTRLYFQWNNRFWHRDFLQFCDLSELLL